MLQKKLVECKDDKDFTVDVGGTKHIGPMLCILADALPKVQSMHLQFKGENPVKMVIDEATMGEFSKKLGIFFKTLKITIKHCKDQGEAIGRMAATAPYLQELELSSVTNEDLNMMYTEAAKVLKDKSHTSCLIKLGFAGPQLTDSSSENLKKILKNPKINLTDTAYSQLVRTQLGCVEWAHTRSLTVLQGSQPNTSCNIL